MQRSQIIVTKRVGIWGSVYIIGGTEVDGEALPAEQADDLIARFEHEQALFGRTLGRAVELASSGSLPDTHASLVAEDDTARYRRSHLLSYEFL